MKAFWVIAFLLASSSHATMAVIDDIRTMTQKSGVVVQAEVVSQKVTQDSRGRIITLSTLRVKDGLKGAQTGQEITLYQLGGEYQGRVMRFQGASVYRSGEQLVLFAVPYQDKMVVSYGLGLGKFNINKRRNGQQVMEDLHDIQVFQMKAGQKTFADPSPRTYKTLEAFKTEIRRAL